MQGAVCAYARNSGKVCPSPWWVGRPAIFRARVIDRGGCLCVCMRELPRGVSLAPVLVIMAVFSKFSASAAPGVGRPAIARLPLGGTVFGNEILKCTDSRPTGGELEKGRFQVVFQVRPPHLVGGPVQPDATIKKGAAGV